MEPEVPATSHPGKILIYQENQKTWITADYVNF